jgi:hypothetical protein
LIREKGEKRAREVFEEVKIAGVYPTHPPHQGSTNRNQTRTKTHIESELHIAESSDETNVAEVLMATYHCSLVMLGSTASTANITGMLSTKADMMPSAVLASDGPISP